MFQLFTRSLRAQPIPRKVNTSLRYNSSSSSPSAAGPSLDATLRQALKGYMKSRASFETGVIKSILADLQTASHTPSPPNPQKTLKKSISSRLEAATQFASSTPPRVDLADQYRREAEILREFLVEEKKLGGMNEADLLDLVRNVVEGEPFGGNVGVKEMGRVIKAVVERSEGKAGGKEVSEVVKKFLSEQK